MKKYLIKYYFDGYGQVEVEAESEEKAYDVFYNGDFDKEEEWGERYNIEEIQDINN